jgi:hypothetical protein
MLTAVSVIAGWAAAYLSLRELLKQRCQELRREFQAQAKILDARVRLLEDARSASPTAVPVSQAVAHAEPGPKPAERAAPIAWPTTVAAPVAFEEVPPETMALIEETVNGFLGQKVRIRSAKKLPAPPPAAHASSTSADPWAQQGRLFVQSSHESIHARSSVMTAGPMPSLSAEKERS